MYKDLYPVVTACEATGLAKRIEGKRREWRGKRANKEWIFKRERGVRLLHLFLRATSDVSRLSESDMDRDFSGTYSGIKKRPWFGPGQCDACL